MSKKKTTKTIASWTRQEIKDLEKLILAHGTDFTMIGVVMGKSRDQVKRKFKVMEKKMKSFGFETENN